MSLANVESTHAQQEHSSCTMNYKSVKTMRKKLLYIDHSFHNKTKSAQFIKEILAEAYDIEICDFDPYDKSPEQVFESLEQREFDVLVLFQVMPNLNKLNAHVHYKHAVFFPMYDGIGEMSDENWEAFRNFNIINFSSTLHKRLQELGMSTYYIQYFPKPFNKFDKGNPSHIYFWQRVSSLNLTLVEKLLKHFPIQKLHLHKVLDPGNIFKEPSMYLASKLEISEWYNTREEMLKDMETCAIYIAPRPYEGIGMGFLEAMAMGRCVIAPNNPTHNEYITDGQNGLLYDYYSPQPIRNTINIAKIQENAYEYIQQGYRQWEENKYKILEWLEAPLHLSKPKRKRKYLNIKCYYLFCLIPIMVVKDRTFKKRYYDLFGFIRLLKSKRKLTGIKYYLFGLIPLWQIKY